MSQIAQRLRLALDVQPQFQGCDITLRLTSRPKSARDASHFDALYPDASHSDASHSDLLEIMGYCDNWAQYDLAVEKARRIAPGFEIQNYIVVVPSVDVAGAWHFLDAQPELSGIHITSGGLRSDPDRRKPFYFSIFGTVRSDEQKRLVTFLLRQLVLGADIHNGLTIETPKPESKIRP